jgi:UDPglucose 6-dehydrogenase
MDLDLSVIGLGKLGVCTAVCFAYKGYRVTGVDVNRDFIDGINDGRAPIAEPRLQDLISASEGRLKATQEYEEAVYNSDITFLVVPTPSREDGHFSDKFLRDALAHLSRALKKLNKKYHLFVITSTVSPGITEQTLIPLIEAVSGKKLNEDFGVCYNPEFIALGSVINDFLNPDLILIGESDKYAGDILEAIYKKVCQNNPYVARMSITGAEITKISLNSYVTMKISFANTLANICERIPGVNIDAITKALGADRRVSPYYLKGGPPYGGPCFPRDNRAFIAFARKYGQKARLAEATDEMNRHQIKHLINLVLTYLPNDKRVSILGLSYKPNTPVIEESQAIKIIEELLKKDLEIAVYDPLAMSNARVCFGNKIFYASSIKDCVSYSSLWIVTTQADEFKNIDGSYLVHHHPTTIIDCWRIIEPERFKNKVVNYIALGKANK